jgi:hypothetical protein
MRRTLDFFMHFPRPTLKAYNETELFTCPIQLNLASMKMLKGIVGVTLVLTTH